MGALVSVRFTLSCKLTFPINPLHPLTLNNHSVASVILQNFYVFVPTLPVITSKLFLISATMQALLSTLIFSPVFSSKVSIPVSAYFSSVFRGTCIAQALYRFWVQVQPVFRLSDLWCVGWVQGRRQPKMSGGDKHDRYLNA